MSLWPRGRDLSGGKGPATKLDVGVLGATWTVGQQLVALLDHHLWFLVRPAIF